jgi:uncharacterized repeat protein (TIGR01451 family)
MAVQGQSFFTASGDSDAYLPGEVDNPYGFGTPAASPYLTSVGGTTLTMSGSGAAWSSERVWNWGGGIGSSGGYSSYYPIPVWQTNVSMTANQGSPTTRNFPDVALTADDVLVIADGGAQYVGVGGTSVAAPLWAGFTALVNQQAVLNGKPLVGFLNPALYIIAKGPDYTNCFHDITTGNNTWSGSPNLYYAVTNYDLCTGLGTPRGTNLINTLATGSTNVITHISPPPPPYGSTVAALNGGNPNGAWQLFVQDDTLLDAGTNYNGWILTLTTANPVGAVCDLALSMVASATNVPAGSDLTYFVGVTNYGVSAATNSVVVDSLPFGVTVISNSCTQGSVGGSIWNIGTLDSGAGAQMTLTVRPYSAGTIDNYAVASSTTPDPNPDDDFALVSVNVYIATPPQISVVRTNGTFTFSITGVASPTVIQASTNLLNWVPVYTNTPPFNYTDPSASNYRYRFYRALQ